MNARSAGQLLLQVHSDTIPSQDLEALKIECEGLAANLVGSLGVRFEEGEDDGRYLNIVFSSDTPEELWSRISAALYLSAVHGPMLRTQSIALRTGHDGWNDYVLLHHFDPSIHVESAHVTDTSAWFASGLPFSGLCRAGKL